MFIMGRANWSMVVDAWFVYDYAYGCMGLFNVKCMVGIYEFSPILK